ncbi:hypothetical protein DSO57_1009534 [Entomophthora muscae]|uniref:Uncharacterized protein n=1 Tax=Entomophthora muscae TaxID=34485 RepID=A0ACC2RLK0_9FUNG|nr:hypothetical protein DSO57_1009534 [Entomophthora muscae]
MTLPLTPQPNCPMEPPTATKTMYTQLFGVLYITLMGIVDSMMPNSGPWSLLGQYLAPILWWVLPTGPAVPHPELPNASTYAWLPDNALGVWKWAHLYAQRATTDLFLCCGVLVFLVAEVQHQLSSP